MHTILGLWCRDRRSYLPLCLVRCLSQHTQVWDGWFEELKCNYSWNTYHFCLTHWQSVEPLEDSSTRGLSCHVSELKIKPSLSMMNFTVYYIYRAYFGCNLKHSSKKLSNNENHKWRKWNLPTSVSISWRYPFLINNLSPLSWFCK